MKQKHIGQVGTFPPKSFSKAKNFQNSLETSNHLEIELFLDNPNKAHQRFPPHPLNQPGNQASKVSIGAQDARPACPEEINCERGGYPKSFWQSL